MKIFVRCLLGMAAIALTLSPATAQESVEDFYNGRTIYIQIAYPPGGSYDSYARLAAGHMGKYIPGNPDIIIQNKSGGISTLRAFIETQPDDGSVMGIFPETIAIVQMTDPNAVWDVRDLTYIGSFAGVNVAFFLREDAPAKSLEDFKTTEINAGCHSPLSQSYINPAQLKNLLGYKINIICGYAGNSEFPPALLRGEIDLVTANWTGWKGRSEVRDGTFKVVLQSGLKRHKDLVDVPLMQEIVTDPTDKKVVEFWSAGSAIGRALVVKNTVPQDRIDALRAAFDKAMADPALLEEAARTNLEIDPTPGVEVQRTSNEILHTPPEIVALAIEATK